MGYRVKGTLKLPDGAPAANCEIEFVSRKNFSPLVQGAKTNILTSATGAYDVTIEFGDYAVILYTGGTYPAQAGVISVLDDTTTGLDLPTLLGRGEWQPATPDYIKQIEAWLVSANASAASAANSANSAASTLANALTKSGNLSGLSSPDAALGNLGLTSFGKAVAKAADAAAGRSALGLVKQTSATDATAGAVLSVGAFGLGAATTEIVADCDSAVVSGFYRTTNTTLNVATAGSWGKLIVSTYNLSDISQIWFLNSSGNRIFTRSRVSGTWGTWVELHTQSTLPYETGAFTPTIAGSTTAGDGTYSSRRGSYARIGRLVTFSLVISWSAHTGTGALRILGLPFVSSSAAEDSHFKWVAIHSNNLTFAGQLKAGVVNANSSIRLYQMLTNAAAAEVPMDSSAQIEINGSYFI